MAAEAENNGAEPDGDAPEETFEDLSPEGRRRTASLLRRDPALILAPRHIKAYEILRRTIIGTWRDGFIHAGNLAYVSLFAIFPFFIFGAAAFSAIGEESERAAAVDAMLLALPPSVGEVIGPAAHDAIEARTGWLLWFGAAFALWTVGGLIETIRDILRRAYGTKPTRSFWFHRLTSAGIIIGAVLMLMLALVAQVLIGAAEEIIDAWLPELGHALDALTLSRIVPAIAVYFSIFLLFLSLTPAAYRGKPYPKWPGALLVTTWWVTISLAFPPVMRSLFSYNLTYGSLAGIMITLFFFWLIGLGVVAGAEFNAALSTSPEEEGERDNVVQEGTDR